ncbi:MAG: hypothetical protein JNL54_07515 [Kineosporiaceae bacterium]|nr:hypothetical protein [Kineosporiaceae bacterium]
MNGTDELNQTAGRAAAVVARARATTHRARHTVPDGGNRHGLIAELREVEYWRRLVAARLDLAVAAVTSLDEPVGRCLPCAPSLPGNLRHLVGLHPEEALEEVALLEHLREVLHDLDGYASALRSTAGYLPESG